MRVALDSRLRGRDEKVKSNRKGRREGAKDAEGSSLFVIPDLIRDPGRQARMVRVALDARLRGRDEKVKVNRSARREGAKGAEVSRKALRAPFTRSRGPSG